MFDYNNSYNQDVFEPRKNSYFSKHVDNFYYSKFDASEIHLPPMSCFQFNKKWLRTFSSDVIHESDFVYAILIIILVTKPVSYSLKDGLSHALQIIKQFDHNDKLSGSPVYASMILGRF